VKLEGESSSGSCALAAVGREKSRKKHRKKGRKKDRKENRSTLPRTK
jgi:hypothetical protein